MIRRATLRAEDNCALFQFHTVLTSQTRGYHALLSGFFSCIKQVGGITVKNFSKPVFILLAICMIVGLLPWTAMPARAESSAYTVEFTYNTLEYVLPGDTSVPMSEILNTLGLTGEVTAVSISATLT